MPSLDAKPAGDPRQPSKLAYSLVTKIVDERLHPSSSVRRDPSIYSDNLGSSWLRKYPDAVCFSYVHTCFLEKEVSCTS